MRTPFDEDDACEYLEKELHPITCPYCHEDMHTHVEDYNLELPPLQNTLTVYWECVGCGSYFITKHGLDDEGCLSPRG